MNDRALRGVARATLFADDQEAYLFHLRLRSGQIAAAKLELLAHLGHQGALRALDREPPQTTLPQWIRALGRWGRTPCARALLLIARSPRQRVRFGRCDRGAPHSASPCHPGWVARLQAWVNCPCASHAHREVECPDGTLCSFPSLLRVRGRRQIGEEASALARHLLGTDRRSRAAIRALIEDDLIQWAGARTFSAGSA
jgi:hypothetical protein